MKRLFALMLALVLALGLVACGSSNDSSNDSGNGADNQQNQSQQPDQPEDIQGGEEDADDGQEPQIPDGEDSTGTDSDSAGDGEDEDDPSGQPQEPDKESMQLSRTDFTLFAAGNTYRLTVSGVEGTSTFSSSDEAVATVAKDGTVTAVAPGTATITVTNGDQKATCVVRCNWKAEEEKPEEPEEPASSSVDLQAFYDDMVSTYEFQSLQNLTGDLLESYYPGMSAVPTEQCLIMGTMMSMNNGEFCLVEVSDDKETEKNVEIVKAIFQERIDQMAGGGAWYPEPTELWTNSSRVVANGNYVMMVVHENCDNIVSAFNDYTK